MSYYRGGVFKLKVQVRNPDTKQPGDPGAMTATVYRPDGTSYEISGERVETGLWRLPPIALTLAGWWRVVVNTTEPYPDVGVFREKVLEPNVPG